MKNGISKIKIAICAIIEYLILNFTSSIIYLIITPIARNIPIKVIQDRYWCIGICLGLSAGIYLLYLFSEKFLVTETAICISKFIVGILLVILHAGFIIAYFINGVGDLEFFICHFIVGIVYIVQNHKLAERNDSI